MIREEDNLPFENQHHNRCWRNNFTLMNWSCIKMKTVNNYNSKTNQKPAKSAPKVQQIRTILSEVDYYDYSAELAQEKSDYYHLYGY